MNYFNYQNMSNPQGKQTHTHEFLGSTDMAEMGRNTHNHRFAGISSEVIPVAGGHIHEIVSNTGFNDEHIHQIRIRTGMPIPVGNNHHIHYVQGVTTNDDGHTHRFQFSTLI